MKNCRFVFAFNSWNFRFPCFFLSILSAFNDFLRNYDFVMIIMREFSTTNESLMHHFTLISLKYLSTNIKRECDCLALITYDNIKQFINLWHFWKSMYEYADVDVRMCSVKKVFWEKLKKNSLENIYAEVSFLIKLQASSLKLHWERIQHRCFPETFEKLLTTIFEKLLTTTFL